jgi:hypothetical protein
MSTPAKKRPGTTVLGIAIERDHFEVVELRRTNGSSEIRRSITVPLETDPLSADPETLGRSLRSQLEQAGIRETRCAVALPAYATLSLTVPVPDLPDADRQSFLDIEAERGFPQNPENLVRQTSIGEPSPDIRHATVIAFERNAIQRIETILRLAKLKPLWFALGLATLQPPDSTETEAILALLPAGNQLAIQITAGKAIAALRVIEDALIPSEDSQELHPDLDLIHRELRITLGQLPAEIRDSVHRVRVFGPSTAARSFAQAIQPRLLAFGLTVELAPNLKPEGISFRLPTHAPASPALAVAIQAAAGLRPALDFLPPRISAWQEFASRYPSQRLVWAGVAGGSIAAVALILFLGQQVVLWRWQSRWDAIKTKVAKVETMQREVRRYEPWFDPSVRSLSILRRLSEAFPDDGSVSAKTIEIRGPTRVACSGTARDQQAWLRMLDKVRSSAGIADVTVEQVRGKAPVEFSFNFVWEGGSGS